MKVVQVILVVAHLLGVLALLVGLLMQVRSPEKRVTSLMRDGIGGTVLAGLLLLGVMAIRSDDIDGAKVGAMGVIGVVILVLVMANVRKERIADWLWWLILALTVVNIGVAFSL